MFIAMMMEAARTSETLVKFYHITRRYNPKAATFVLTAVRTSKQTIYQCTKYEHLTASNQAI
jgi:hypothetical protein